MNRLTNEKSAYLQQHAQNPVHWWPYCQEALDEAKKQNKPIFISIGYSSCHWCHVMAEESFQDEQTAQMLNESFICIKIDKEEYPDIDQYYQAACQMFIQTGGWPLSAFTLPDMRPYFVGTYFPLQPRENLNSFKEVIQELKRAYTEEREKVEENANKVTEAIEKGVQDDRKVEFQGHFPAPSSILEAIDQFADKKNGGYGQPPKFPQFSFYEWACEQMLEGMVDKKFGEHIVQTLEQMFTGGVFDQVRGGIHRYSTDEKWMIPHFEKMLYDQAGLLRVLSKLSLLYPSPLFYDHLVNTLNYLEKEMLSENGYLFSAQDADSEGVEGLYFTYTCEEFEDLLTSSKNQLSEGEEDLGLEDKVEQIKSWFQVTEKGNFERGLNIIGLNLDKKEEIFTEQGWKIVRKVRQLLLEERKRRIPPATDNKGVASWNFMLISSLVDVMQFCRIESIRHQASGLFNKLLEGNYKTFILQRTDENEQKQSSLRHTTTQEISIPYLEDYVTFADMQLRVYEITGNPNFKDNFKESLNLITQKFIDTEGKVRTRAIETPMPVPYPNQVASFFDASFRSSVASLVGLVRRARVLFKDENLGKEINFLIEEFKNSTLKNPIASGEALRALTYPDQAYRTINIPRKWLTEPKFLDFIPYFLPRFILNYHEDETREDWEICSIATCEMNGKTLDEFIKTLTPPKPKE